MKICIFSHKNDRPKLFEVSINFIPLDLKISVSGCNLSHSCICKYNSKLTQNQDKLDNFQTVKVTGGVNNSEKTTIWFTFPAGKPTT